MKKGIFGLVVLISSIAWSGSDVGNGGDLVKCVPNGANNLVGLYSLDYLVFSTNGGVQPAPAGSWQESIFRVRRIFVDKLPELLPVFDDFVNNILNEDQTRHQVWEPSDYALKELNDEDLPISVKIPVNCRENGKVQLVQAVIRQFPEFTGSQLIVYKYMPRIFEKTAAEKPLQLSFLLVHEFLWSISDNVDRNRRINWFLHSQEIEKLSRVDVIDRLLGMGLNIQEVPRVLDANGRGHFTSLQEALSKARENETIIVKEGTYTTGGTSIVRPVKLIGEGDRAKIIIKSGEAYPAIDVDLTPEQRIVVENVSVVRNFNPRRENWYKNDVIRVNSGELHMNNVSLDGDSKYVFRVNDRQVIKMNNMFIHTYRGVLLESRFRGRLQITNSLFVSYQTALDFGDARPKNVYFEGNTFDSDHEKDQYHCPLDIDFWEHIGPINEKLAAETRKFFEPFFKNNTYLKRNPAQDWQRICYLQ